MVSKSTAGRISESTAINENDLRLVYLFWESSTQSLDQHLAIFSISKREVTSSSTMSLTDVVAKMTISIRIFVHDVESNCHVRQAQRVISRQRCQSAKNVDLLFASSRSMSETSRRWYCRCQGVHGFGCPQQLRRQRLIIQQIEIRHVNQHQSRLGIFVHSEVETRLIFYKNTALCHVLDQT